MLWWHLPCERLSVVDVVKDGGMYMMQGDNFTSALL
jgi:hypothetical protein